MIHQIQTLHFKSILIGLLLLAGCSKEDGGTNPFTEGGDNDIVSGNPALNSFLITSNDESVMLVDAQSGQEETVFTFADLTDIELLADYSNGWIFVTTDDNAVNAIDINAKDLVWDTPMLEYKFSSLGLTPPGCIDGICYASGGFGVVVALDENTGNLLWHYSSDPDGELDSVLNENEAPVIYGDKVFVLSEADFLESFPAYLHVLDKNTGQLLNKLELPYDINATPTLYNNLLFIPAKNLYAVDADTFEVKWIFEADRVGTPFVSGDRLVVHGIPLDETIYSRTYCLDLDTGNVIWNLDSGFNTIWEPIIVEDIVFGVFEEASVTAFSVNGRPFAVRLSDGQQIWFRDDVSIDNSPVYANGRLFFHGHAINRTGDTDADVGLFSMDANTGEILWLNNTFRYQYTITPLVVAENGIFGPSYYRGK